MQSLDRASKLSRNMAMSQQAVMSPEMAAVAAKEEGVEVVGRIEQMFRCSEGETSEQLKALLKGKKEDLGGNETFGDVSTSPVFDERVLPVKTTRYIVEQSSQSNSPISQLDFDVMATRYDFDNLKTNHSHNAYEIQRKTQAMRELDLLLSDDDDDDGAQSVSVTLIPSNADGSKAKATKRRHCPVQRKTARDDEWLFSCGLDDIYEDVEDLLSPLEDVTNFSCLDDGIIDSIAD
jgi:hypothetical protein